MAWLPTLADSPLPGRLDLFSTRQADDGKSVVRQRMLVGKPVGVGYQLTMGQAGDHQNAWLYGAGVALLYEPGVDTNLRALIARKGVNDDTGPYAMPLELRPKADGIVDYHLRNWNDWEVLRVDLCRTLVSAGNGSLHCPSWAW
jgi:hypothetical protein